MSTFNNINKYIKRLYYLLIIKIRNNEILFQTIVRVHNILMKDKLIISFNNKN